ELVHVSRNLANRDALRATRTGSASRCSTGTAPVAKAAVRRPPSGRLRLKPRLARTAAPRATPTPTTVAETAAADGVGDPAWRSELGDVSRKAWRFARLRDTWTSSASRCSTGTAPVVKTAVRRPSSGCIGLKRRLTRTSAPRTSPTPITRSETATRYGLRYASR